MKLNKLLTLSFVLFGFLSSCKTSRNVEINMLTVKNTQIYEELKLIVEEESEYSDMGQEIIVIKIKKTEDYCEIRIGVLSKNLIGSYLTRKQDSPIGYFEYEDITVVVFGNEDKSLFEKTDKKKSIPFLEIMPELEIIEGEIPPPPVIYEPIVWIYSYENKKLKPTDKGRYTLLY